MCHDGLYIIAARAGVKAGNSRFPMPFFAYLTGEGRSLILRPCLFPPRSRQVLTGDEDNAISNSLSKEMADGIAGANLVVLSQCGHLSQVEQPEATANALVEWLRN